VNDDFEDSEPLQPDEIARLREMLKADDRTVWLWSTIKVWATWIAAVVLGISMGWDALKRIIISLR
jgi:hypothetical protein